MYVERHEVTITTDASGDGIGYTPDVCGRIISIQYVKTDYADGVDFTITGAKTGIGILAVENANASAVWFPRSQIHDSADGSGLTWDGTYKLVDAVGVVDEQVKIVVAAGGDTKSGKFYVTVG